MSVIGTVLLLTTFNKRSCGYTHSITAVYDGAGMSHDLTNITLALRTLGTFDFEGHSLTKLLRHCADNFLASDNEEVRLEAVKTCSALLTYISVRT